MLNTPHLFQRSGKRGGRKPQPEGADKAVVARTISAQLGNMIDRAEGADLKMLAYLIDIARIEAERVAGEPRIELG